MERGCILLKDQPAEKAGAWLPGGIGKKVTAVNALKGELLTAILDAKPTLRNDGKQPNNYRLVKDETITVHAEDDDIAPLNDREFLLLVAIKSPLARYEVFISDKMDWGLGLKPSDAVYVTTQGNVRVSAIIRYVGDIANRSGLLFGVEIMDANYRGQGTTDGTYNAKRYFYCKDNCGLFVSLERLSPDAPDQSTHTQGSSTHTQGSTHSQGSTHAQGGTHALGSTHSQGSTHAQGGTHALGSTHTGPARGAQGQEKSHSYNTRSKTPATNQGVGSSVDVETQFSIGDRVIAYNRNGATVHGTVRWAGKIADGKTVRSLGVGIETDHPVRKEDFEDAIQLKSQPFKVSDHRHGIVYLPEAFVLPEQPVIHEQPRRLEASLNPQHGANLAKEYGFHSEEEMLGEQSEALRQAKEGKDAQELEEIKKAVQTEQIDIDKQREALLHLQKKKKESDTAAVASWQPPPGAATQHPQSGSSTRAVDDQRNPPHIKSQSSYPGSQPHRQLSDRSMHHYDSIGNVLDEAEIARRKLQSHGAQHGASPNPAGGSQPTAQPFPGLGPGSIVQVANPPHYGVIRWVGGLPGFQGLFAGVELEEPMDGCEDGTWQGTRYFTCPPGRGFFCQSVNVKPDQRFTEGVAVTSTPMMNPLDDVAWEEPTDQTIGHNQIRKYFGDNHGIQGHQNSCYLDATVFGLFALSAEFDEMFLNEAKDTAGQAIKDMLWKGIVNPLRKHGVVRHESVMKLRNKLEELGKMKGVNQDEKDPEEFLNMLFKHTLNMEPFISIKRPFGTEKEYFVQLFLEPDESLKLPPTVGQLLNKMFKEQNISFTRVPSKLLIQVPRFGKKFKTYEKVIPALHLDVQELVDSPVHCFICGKSAWNKCSECTHDFKNEQAFIYFCDSCSKLVHSNPSRPNHEVLKCDEDLTDIGSFAELDLLSVICIETSHYVCFSQADNKWIFFDSMANRVYDQYNIPKGVDCTRELNEWVYCKDLHRLLNTPSRELPEYVRRFTQDIYLCIYIQPDVGMY